MKTIITIVSLSTAFLTFSAHADVKLQDNSKILGKWQVNAESLGLEKEKKPLDVTWDFKKDGTLQTVGEDHHSKFELDISIKYSVENGLIKKQTSPGREKYDDCAVLEMGDKDMILRCKGLYYFMTRK